MTGFAESSRARPQRCAGKETACSGTPRGSDTLLSRDTKCFAVRTPSAVKAGAEKSRNYSGEGREKYSPDDGSHNLPAATDSNSLWPVSSWLSSFGEHGLEPHNILQLAVGAPQNTMDKAGPKIGELRWCAASPDFCCFSCRARSIAIKRHLESGDQEPSSKHFLSEDKMAARFNSLSLDNDHIYGSNGFPIQDEDSTWQEAYLRLKELQRRLSQDGTTEETGSTDEENELNSVIVDGEFLMADCPMLTHPSHLQEVLGGVSLVPEETFLSLNPCTEVVLWSPPGNSVLHTIRTLMAVPSSLSPSTQPQQDVGLTQEEMEI
ncbi:uncharacterized protein LOC128329491 isoform X1 [Hemicordylus capensis]|uniref:uncharacterized protein LOC128329491 isoform X1 n=1 Tax=Hemicordylus capensis TaxID=884348 RepID=UPI0023024D95|nr:uncharacterized protein LOC128329491 isoform X1 [Hemicordylus capensis]